MYRFFDLRRSLHAFPTNNFLLILAKIVIFFTTLFRNFILFDFWQIFYLHLIAILKRLDSPEETQPSLTCLKLTIETLEQSVEICSKLRVKTPERLPVSFWCLYC